MSSVTPMNPLSCSALNEELANHHPKTTAEVIEMTRRELQALDDKAQKALDDALDCQRGEVFPIGTPGFSLPPGAAHCPQAEFLRYGPMDMLKSGTKFTSFVSHYGLVSGKYMFEIMVFSDTSYQIGFCGPANMFLWDEKKGVGDFPFSVGYDGHACQLRNVGTSPAGWKWAIGDIISVTFDLDIGEVTYYQNGRKVVNCHLPTVKSLLAAGIRHSDQDAILCYFPAVSLSPRSECAINLGGFPMMQPVEGFSGIDPSFEFLFITWVPRLGTLDMVPAHLQKHKYLISAIIMQKVLEDPETHFMDFVACLQEYLVVLSLCSEKRALEFVQMLKLTMSEEMLRDFAFTILSCNAMFASMSTFLLVTRCGTFNLVLEGVSAADRHEARSKPSVFLNFMEFIMDAFPEGIPTWANGPQIALELLALADLKVPNDIDLMHMFPATSDASCFTGEGLMLLQSQQVLFGRSNLQTDEDARSRIFIKIMQHPDLKTRLAIVVHTIINEVKDSTRMGKRQKTGDSHPVYTDRMISRLFFHIIFAYVRLYATSDDRSVADALCPLSVLKIANDYPNFSGITHEQLMTPEAKENFRNVPDFPLSNPCSLVYLACELYMLVVKPSLTRVYDDMIHCHLSRLKYLEAAKAGQTPPEVLAAMLEEALISTRRLSWNMASLSLSGVHPGLVNFSALCYRMVNHYASTPYASFIPTMFVECATDLLHFCRQTCPSTVKLRVPPEIPLFFMSHVRSPIIHHQPTREYILMSLEGIAGMHEHTRRQAVKALANCIPILWHGLSQILAQFSDPMAWTLVVNLLHRQNSGGAFCVPELDLSSDAKSASFRTIDPIPAESFTAFKELNALVVRYFYDSEFWSKLSYESSPLSFLMSAVTHTNWCLTELCTVFPSDLTKERLAIMAKDKKQRATSIFDFTTKVLHILEGIVGFGFNFFFETDDDGAGTAPGFFMPQVSASSKRALVAEVVSQTLERVAKNDSGLNTAAKSKITGLESISVERMLAPVVGLLFNMMGPKPEEIVSRVEHLSPVEASAQCISFLGGDISAVSPEVAEYLHALSTNNSFFVHLAIPSVEWNPEQVRYTLTKIDWVAVCRESRSNSKLLRYLPLAAMAYEAVAFKRLQSQQTSVGGAEDDDNIALCPICCVRPLEVTFVPCGHQTCDPCITRHRVTDHRCFFCKADVSSTTKIGPPTMPQAGE